MKMKKPVVSALNAGIHLEWKKQEKLKSGLGLAPTLRFTKNGNAKNVVLPTGGLKIPVKVNEIS